MYKVLWNFIFTLFDIYFINTSAISPKFIINMCEVLSSSIFTLWNMYFINTLSQIYSDLSADMSQVLWSFVFTVLYMYCINTCNLCAQIYLYTEIHTIWPVHPLGSGQETHSPLIKFSLLQNTQQKTVLYTSLHFFTASQIAQVAQPVLFK